MKIPLAKRLDTAAVQELYDQLSKHQGRDISLDGSQVEQMGGLCLQTLLAAQKQWQKTGHHITIETMSDAMAEHVRILGAQGLLLTPDTMEECP
ncbi:MAG: STAS domain-containing protein [Halocynthiibacter sp.]